MSKTEDILSVLKGFTATQPKDEDFTDAVGELTPEEVIEDASLNTDIDEWNRKQNLISAESALIDARKKMFWSKIENRYGAINIILRTRDGVVYKRPTDKLDK